MRGNGRYGRFVPSRLRHWFLIGRLRNGPIRGRSVVQRGTPAAESPPIDTTRAYRMRIGSGPGRE
eukprot:4648015-Pyramimonas_sp.AAC.1